MHDHGFDLGTSLEDSDRRRRLTPTDRIDSHGYVSEPPGGGLPVLGAAELCIFASDNYLGLTANQRVQTAVRQAARAVGTGSGGSRHTTGDTIIHHDLEHLLADVLQTERALTFSSGYAANVGTIAALEPDVVFVDEHVHASVVDGCRLSGADIFTYEHCNASSLRGQLETRDREHDSWLVVTSSVFPGDGRVAPLSPICEAAEAAGAWVMVDETHAVGLYAGGGGVVQAEGLEERVQIQVGSLSTALASQGGYVAGTDSLIEYLATEARPFGCSAGLSPPAAATASEALHLSRHGDCREHLWENVAHLRDGLHAMGYEVLGESQILSVVAVDPSTLVTDLRNEGILVQRPLSPSVRGGARAQQSLEQELRNVIRVTPMATHEQEDIVSCLEGFHTVLNDTASQK